MYSPTHVLIYPTTLDFMICTKACILIVPLLYRFNIYNAGSIFWLAFSDKIHIRKASEIDSESMSIFKKLHKALLEKGIYLGPSGFEVGFISLAHTCEILDQAIIKFNEALDKAFANN